MNDTDSEPQTPPDEPEPLPSEPDQDLVRVIEEGDAGYGHNVIEGGENG